MATQFTACQTVRINVPPQPIPIQHYLRQPQRLVNALTDNSRIQQLSEEVFRLKMRPLTFMSLSIQPTVDLKVWAESHGTIQVRSVNSQILGFEYINRRWSLNLQGYLSPQENNNITILQGKADLKVEVDIPAPFCFTPQPILEATGNGLLKSILMTIKQRLQHQLLADYHQWATSQGMEPLLIDKTSADCNQRSAKGNCSPGEIPILNPD